MKKKESRLYGYILPTDVYVSLLGEALPDADLQAGRVINEWGNIQSGNNFIDVFAGLIRKHGYRPVKFYASLMGVDLRLMPPTMLALTGISAREWIHEYLILEVCELIEKTDLRFIDIGKRLNMSPVSFSRFFRLMRKCQPYEWRTECRYGKRFKRSGN